MTEKPAPVGPLAYTCPNCQAKPGERCTQPTDTSRKPVSWFHSARTDKAEGW
jgi:hypothetical protein